MFLGIPLNLVEINRLRSHLESVRQLLDVVVRDSDAFHNTNPLQFLHSSPCILEILL